MNILLTSGGTKVKIDRVRHIGNMSHGTFGSAIAKHILFSQDVKNLTFLYAEGSKTPFTYSVNYADNCSPFHEMERAAVVASAFETHRHRYSEVPYRTYEDYESALVRLLAQDWDAVILAAAVSDYVVGNYIDGKIRSKDAMAIRLEPAKKLISEVKKINPKCLLIGFKLLVNSTDEELVAAAQDSAIKNDCYFVVANDLRDIQDGKHRLLIVDKGGLFKTVLTEQAKTVAEMVVQAVKENKRP